MRKILISRLSVSRSRCRFGAKAQVDLSAYADPEISRYPGVDVCSAPEPGRIKRTC